jgi:tetratricopeptide (TPR) repeat protein
MVYTSASREYFSGEMDVPSLPFKSSVSHSPSVLVSVFTVLHLSTSHLFFPVSIPQADGYMSSLKHLPLTSTESHPKDPVFLHDLAAECFKRHGLSGERDDLDKLILRLSEKSSLALAESGADCAQTLLDLALAHIHRFKEFGEPGDVNPTIASGIPPVYLANLLQALTRAALDAYSRDKQLKIIDQAIECLREALKTCSPGSHQVRVSFDLSNLLAVRFLVHHADENFVEAKVLLDPLTAPPSPGDSPCPYRRQALALKAALGYAQSIASPNAGKSDGAISRCRSFLDDCSSSFGNPFHHIITELLLLMCQTEQGSNPPQGASARVAHLNLDSPSFLQLRSFGEIDESDVVQTAPSLTDVGQEIERLRKHLSSTSLLTDRQRDCLNKLVRCYRTKVSLTHDITDIEDAITWYRRLLNSTHPSDLSMSFHRSSFANFLYFAFIHIKRVEYLDESVTLHREVLGVEDPRLIRFATIRRLIESLSSRLRLFRHESDLDEIMELFASGVEDTYATVPSRFELACDWAYTARISVHHSLPTAYEYAMSLMQSSLVFAPTLPIQHDRLVEKRDLYKTPLNFASYQIRMGKLELAIETLEQGRALLWSEMHGLRTSTDQLRTADPGLADKFTAINKELEILTTSTWSDEGLGIVDGIFECDKQMVQYPDLMVRQQKLLKDRDALMWQIRGLPGFENFLLPLSFDALRSASSNGPVIIINHCELGSDILIVFHDSAPSHIQTSYDFFDRANCSKVKLLAARQKYGLDRDSGDYQKALSFVLEELYELVGRPVIERLNKAGVPEQSRVWWCPTSIFGYLPLHAMGPIPSDKGDLRYFSDLYITSYTPTLSALITSRKPDSDTQMPALPTLLVAQPSPSPPGAWTDAQVIPNLDLQATSLNPGNTTLTTVLDGLRRHRFACIAYNGELKTGRPFEASIRFPNGEYLTLLDFVRSQHPAGEFALLPGSHTAELTEESIPDEALRLSAAVQYSGFRSVIGTLCGMDDSADDEQDLAKAVLLSMFSGKGGEEPYYERSARALRDAVQQMRCNLPLMRWVNYVHYGA